MCIRDSTEDQAETDRYWNAIVGNGGQESMCGWCKDKWGVSWQITPRILAENMDNPDKATRDAGMQKMMNDPRVDPKTNPMPFDGMRMIFGGFQPVVDLSGKAG